MRVLQIIVVVGGIGLLVGFYLLIQEVQSRRGVRAEEGPPPSAVAIPLPTGARVISATPHGSGSAVLVDGPQPQLLIIDRKGDLLRRVTLDPQSSRTP